MFKFDGCIDRGSFVRAALLRLGLFTASVVGFPFLLNGLVYVSGCAGIGGACGALGLVAATAFKPFAFVLLVSSFVGVSMRRARDAGVPGPVGLFIPLLFAASYTFLIYAGAPWTLAFSAGVLFESRPWEALLALYCIAILCVMPSRNNCDATANPFGIFGLVAFGLGLLIATNVTLKLVTAFVSIQLWAPQLSWLSWFRQVFPYLMIALAAALALIAWQYRIPSAEAAESSIQPRGAEKYPKPPILWLLALALILALVACAVGLGDEGLMFVPWVLIINLTSMLLPTLAMYFFLLISLWLSAVRRIPLSSGLLLLALLPFLHWGYAQWTAFEDHERESAEIAAIETKQAPNVPTTIVFESRHLEGIHAVWKVPAIERVIAKGPYGSTLIQFERDRSRNYTGRQSTVAFLPDEYLLLKAGRSSRYANKAKNFAAAGGPLELRYVNSSHDDLVSIWYRAHNPSPTALPMLTTSGWFRGSNSASMSEIDARVGDFLVSALKKLG